MYQCKSCPRDDGRKSNIAHKTEDNKRNLKGHIKEISTREFWVHCVYNRRVHGIFVCACVARRKRHFSEGKSFKDTGDFSFNKFNIRKRKDNKLEINTYNLLKRHETQIITNYKARTFF